ncbi:MAG: AMP-binding protein [Blastocatellia bacterium]
MPQVDPTPHLERFSGYEQAVTEFRWLVPERFNIADFICRRHPNAATRAALIEVKDTGGSNIYTFGALDFLSDKFANALTAFDVSDGDRVAVILPQCAALPIAHFGILKLGGVVVPLTTMFGRAAFDFRLKDSSVSAIVCDDSMAEILIPLLGGLDKLKAIFVVADITMSDAWRQARASGVIRDFWTETNTASSDFLAVDTPSSKEAFILYTSGSTGDPKGAVHRHGFLIGHLPAMEMCYNFDFADDTTFWTPADWAWVGALFDSLYPALYYGRPVVARRFQKFSGDDAFKLIDDFGITNAFIPPTALRLMKRDVPDPRAVYQINLRSVFSGGESLTPEIYDWACTAVGATVNEGYGQTEANMLVSNCSRWFPAKIGSMGRTAPGHTVEIIDDSGCVLPPGEEGHIALKRPDPVMFVEYLNKPEKTAAAFIGEWLNTGDLGVKDEEGHLWFRSRSDDLIKTAAYRVGPSEIERVILAHPSVAQCAVVGIPDETRGAIIKAFITLSPSAIAGEQMIADLQASVRDQIGRHAYPREIEIVEELPTTTTGKIKRKDLRDREIERRRTGKGQ